MRYPQLRRLITALSLSVVTAHLAAEATVTPSEPVAEPEVTVNARAASHAEVIGIWHWDVDKMLAVAAERSSAPTDPEMAAIMREAMTNAFGRTQLTITTDQLQMAVDGNVIELRHYQWLSSDDPSVGMLRSKMPDRPEGHRSERIMHLQKIEPWLVITDPRGGQSMWLLAGPPPQLSTP